LINETLTKQQLTIIFKILFQLQGEERLLPNDKKYENLFQITESQWLFLYYQFEKHGIINRNQIIFNEANWRNGFNNILKRVQEGFTVPQMYCCSRCGYSLQEWEPEQQPIRKLAEQSWQSKLKNLMLIE